MKTIVVLAFLNVVLANNFFDVNDLLNSDLMPGSLLLLEGQTESNQVIGRNVSIQPKKSDVVTGGSIKEAFNTMGFHRYVLFLY